MARTRKQALVTLHGRVAEVVRHLERIAQNPAHSSVQKWRSEIRNWLREMKEVLPYVGKKTAAKWQTRIEAYEAALEV